MDGVDEQVGDEEEEVGTAETGQQMVEDVPHRPKNIVYQNSGDDKVLRIRGD